MQYEELLSQFKLLTGMLKQPDNTEIDGRLARLTKLIDEKMPDTLKKNAPPNYYELYSDFRSLYAQFRNFVLYDRLIGKNVVALGGGFSSGKSSFLNALDGENALPTDVDPSTAVPTFIVNGEKHESFGINIFNARVAIGLRDIRAISHGFGDIRDEDGSAAAEPITLGHIIQSVFLVSPKQTYKNLAFVDTPGFSKPDSGAYSAKTDEYIARGQLKSSSYMVLFVQADSGTLKKDEILFFQSLGNDIPKLFIISKADKKSPRELVDIAAHIKSQLAASGIACTDVLTFSSKDPDGYDGPAIRAVFSKWNETKTVSQFTSNFNKLFIDCRAYYEREIEDERRRLERLNTSLTRLGTEDSETLEPLRRLVTEIQGRIGKLRGVYEELKNLKDEFFIEMKRACEQIGIYMPEPVFVQSARLIGENAAAGIMKTTLEELKEIAQEKMRRRYIVSDLTLNTETDEQFDNCFAAGKKITFRHCDFACGKPLTFEAYDEVVFNNCAFNDFTAETVVLNNVKKALFLNCNFTHCIKHYGEPLLDSKNNEWSELGGVIKCRMGRGTEVDIDACVFKNCGGMNTKNCQKSSIISNGGVRCAGSTFEHCRNTYRGSFGTTKDIDERAVLFSHVSHEADNTLHDSSRLKP